MKGVAICIGLLLAWAGVVTAQQHATVEKAAKQTSAEQLQQALGKDAKILVIDVRSPQEFAAGHIPGAVNIPLGELARKLDEMKVAKDTTLVTMCEHGGRSSRAALELQKLGYPTASFCTLESWRKCGYKIESGDAKPRAAANAYKFICQHCCHTPRTWTKLANAPATARSQMQGKRLTTAWVQRPRQGFYDVPDRDGRAPA
jgi:rhodanese-related sulfurtransferase